MTTATQPLDQLEIISMTGGLKLRSIDLDLLHPNPWQTRKHLERLALIELAEDIRTNGLLQPVVVRMNPEAETQFQIAAGHRRYEAFKMLRDGYEMSGPPEEDEEGNLIPGLETPGSDLPVTLTLQRNPDPRYSKIPVIVRVFSNEEMMRVVLSENSKRKDVAPIEEALAFKKMIGDLSISQSEFARRMQLGQSTVANRLRMLNLPETVQQLLADGKLSQWQGMKLLEFQSKQGLNDWYLEKLGAALAEGRAKLQSLENAYNFGNALANALGIAALEMDTTPMFDVKKECIESNCEFYFGPKSGYGSKVCGRPGHYHHLRAEFFAEERRLKREAELADQRAVEESNARFQAQQQPPQKYHPATTEEINARHAQQAQARAAQLEQIELEKLVEERLQNLSAEERGELVRAACDLMKDLTEQGQQRPIGLDAAKRRVLTERIKAERQQQQQSTGLQINRVDKLETAKVNEMHLLILQVVQALTKAAGTAQVMLQPLYRACNRYAEQKLKFVFQNEAALLNQVEKLETSGLMHRVYHMGAQSYGLTTKGVEAIKASGAAELKLLPDEPERDEKGVRLITTQDKNHWPNGTTSFSDYMYNGFPLDECQQCEYYARLKQVDGKLGGYFCLRPPHFQELREKQDQKLREELLAKRRAEQVAREARLAQFKQYGQEKLLAPSPAMDKATARMLARLVMSQVHRDHPVITMVQAWLKSRDLSPQLVAGAHHNFHEAAVKWIDEELNRLESKGSSDYAQVVMTAAACIPEVWLSNTGSDNALPLWVLNYVEQAVVGANQAEVS